MGVTRLVGIKLGGERENGSMYRVALLSLGILFCLYMYIHMLRIEKYGCGFWSTFETCLFLAFVQASRNHDLLLASLWRSLVSLWTKLEFGRSGAFRPLQYCFFAELQFSWEQRTSRVLYAVKCQ